MGIGHIVTVDYPKYVRPNTRFLVRTKVINEGTEPAWFKVLLTDVDTDTYLGSLGGLISPNITASLGIYTNMPDRELPLQARLDSEGIMLDSKTFTVYPKAEEPEPEPKPVSLLPLIIVVFIVILMFIWMVKKS